MDAVWEGEEGGGARTNLVGEFGDDGFVWRLDAHHQHEPLHSHSHNITTHIHNITTHIHNISTGASTPIFSLVSLPSEDDMQFEWIFSA